MEVSIGWNYDQIASADQVLNIPAYSKTTVALFRQRRHQHPKHHHTFVISLEHEVVQIDILMTVNRYMLKK